MSDSFEKSDLFAHQFFAKVAPNFFVADAPKVFRGGARRFAYYTTAETALKLIQNKKIWLRNCTLMNDISEVRHGVDATYNAFNGEAGAERLRLIRAAAPYFANILESFYRSGEADKAIGESYVMSLTSHLPRESHLGRLSMWRAYGGASGVALIFNSKAFLSSSQNPGIFSGVVNYLSPPQLVAELDGIIDRLRQYKEELDLIDPHLQDNYFKMIIAAASIFVKHEGFKEEREYRVFSSPLVRGGGLVSYDTAIIRGIPQRVIKIPLAKVIEGSNQSSILNDLLEGVIIGPTVSPQ